MLRRIHVHQQNLRANAKDGGDRPVIIVRTYKGSEWGYEAEWTGPTRVVYPEKPLSCGARVWVETPMPVKIVKRRVA